MVSFNPPQISQTEYIRNNEKRLLRKRSNRLGFFILSYYCSMLVFTITFMFLLSFSTGFSMDGTYEAIPLFLLETLAAVASALIPGLIYLILCNQKISEIIITQHVKLKILIPVIFIGMAAAMVANTASDLLAQNFSIFGLENTADFSNTISTPVEFILYIISTAIVPAFAEEFAFRGILMGTLRKYGDVFAIIASSVIFGAMHGNTTQALFAFILGLIFAFIDCKTNSIIPSIIVHFINNFYAVILDVLNTTGVVSERMYVAIYFLLVTLFCIFGIISLIYLMNKDKNFFKISDKDNSGYIFAEYLTLKEKFKAFFINPGIIIVSVLFIIEMISFMGVV